MKPCPPHRAAMCFLTVMPGNLHRLPGAKVGNGFENARSKHIFRDLVNATANIEISENEVTVHFHKRAHNPLLIACDFPKTDIAIPWLQGKQLRLKFG